MCLYLGPRSGILTAETTGCSEFCGREIRACLSSQQPVGHIGDTSHRCEEQWNLFGHDSTSLSQLRKWIPNRRRLAWFPTYRHRLCREP